MAVLGGLIYKRIWMSFATDLIGDFSPTNYSADCLMPVFLLLMSRLPDIKKHYPRFEWHFGYIYSASLSFLSLGNGFVAAGCKLGEKLFFFSV